MPRLPRRGHPAPRAAALSFGCGGARRSSRKAPDAGRGDIPAAALHPPGLFRLRARRGSSDPGAGRELLQPIERRPLDVRVGNRGAELGDVAQDGQQRFAVVPRAAVAAAGNGVAPLLLEPVDDRPLTMFGAGMIW